MTLVRVYPKNGYPKKNVHTNYGYSDLLHEFISGSSSDGFRPRTNVIEKEDRFELEVALPGVEKNHVNIDLHKNELTVSGNSENTEERNYHRREFNVTHFKRVFNLPESVNTDKISASMENGILNVVLPKKEEAIDKGPKGIKIS